MRRSLVLTGLLALLLSGCTYDPSYRGIRCTGQRVCPDGYVCVGYGEDAYCVRQDHNDTGLDGGADGDASPADDGESGDTGPDCDRDGDGFSGPQCGGDDCDDQDRLVFPGGTEGPRDSPNCSDSKDNDCDRLIDRDDPDCARDWWNPDFGRRRKIRILNADQQEDLVDFPVLVKLDPGRIDYPAASGQGADLRFVDADHATLLAHEIESWNPGGESCLWVKVPRIDGASNQDCMWLYYGNSRAQDAQDPAGVWSPGHQAVYHLDGMADSASGFDLGDHGTVDTAGRVGRARLLETDSGSYLDMGSELPLLMGVSGWTLSAWIRPDHTTFGGDHYVTSISVHTNVSATSNSRASLGLTSRDEVIVGGRAADDEQLYRYAQTNSGPIVLGEWVHLVGVAEYGLLAGRIRIYVNGQLEASQNANFTQDQSDTTTTTSNAIGSQDDASEGFFHGAIDEVRILPVIRSSDWIAAQYLTQSFQFLEFLEEETY